MSKKHSIASKARWKDISPEIRSEKMRKIALIKQSKLTVEDKKKIGKMLLSARLKR